SLLDRVSPALIASLISPETLKSLQQTGAALGSPIDEQMIEMSCQVAKILTLYGIGGLLLLSQIWVITRYLHLASAIEREASLPPILK
ncbi:MAG: hypothetical protein ABSH19_00155, partial [Opitutales bacterium]